MYLERADNLDVSQERTMSKPRSHGTKAAAASGVGARRAEIAICGAPCLVHELSARCRAHMRAGAARWSRRPPPCWSRHLQDSAEPRHGLHVLHTFARDLRVCEDMRVPVEYKVLKSLRLAVIMHMVLTNHSDRCILLFPQCPVFAGGVCSPAGGVSALERPGSAETVARWGAVRPKRMNAQRCVRS